MPGIRSQSSLQALGLLPGARRRSWSVLLVLALALASFMHVAHSHDADAPANYKQLCTFCSTFDRGGAPPPVTQVVLPVGPAPVFLVAPPPSPAAAQGALRPACQPRAPPFLQA
jgi:hypothetical protein